MKTVIFSDTHLSEIFEVKRFNFLKRIILDADRVIINGDFWEGWLISFSQFIKSPWNQLFPYLKAKRTVYIYGNHDPKEASDSRVYLFSNKQTERYIVHLGINTLIIEHGHKFKYGYKKLLHHKFILSLIRHPLLVKTLSFLEGKGVALGKKSFYTLTKRLNKTMKTQSSLKGNQILVCGHTHAAEMDLTHQFINTGIIQYGLAQYLTIEDVKIHFYEEWYS